MRLKSDIEEIESRNEAVMIMGDMNRAIGNGDLGIKDNKDKISKGGKMIRDLINEKPYTILNSISYLTTQNLSRCHEILMNISQCDF